MYKTISISLIITALLFLGCTQESIEQTEKITQPVTTKTTTETETTAQDFTFEHEIFTLQLPAAYNERDAKSDLLRAVDGKSFPNIVYSISKSAPDLTRNNLKTLEQERMDTLCEDTDACGTIMDTTNITLSGKEGIKYLVKYSGRSIDDDEGYINEYYHSLYDSENTYRFWTSASDQENSENIEKEFDTIMNTIKFK